MTSSVHISASNLDFTFSAKVCIHPCRKTYCNQHVLALMPTHQTDNLSEVMRSKDELVHLFFVPDLVVLLVQVFVHVETVHRLQRVSLTNLWNETKYSHNLNKVGIIKQDYFNIQMVKSMLVFSLRMCVFWLWVLIKVKYAEEILRLFLTIYKYACVCILARN